MRSGDHTFKLYLERACVELSWKPSSKGKPKITFQKPETAQESDFIPAHDAFQMTLRIEKY